MMRDNKRPLANGADDGVHDGVHDADINADDASSNIVSDALLAYFSETPTLLDADVSASADAGVSVQGTVQAPPRDLWPEIESRLSPANVVPIQSRQGGRFRPLPQWTTSLVAAALLIVATSGVTYLATKHHFAVPQQTAASSEASSLQTPAGFENSSRVNIMPQSSVPIIQVTNTQDGRPDVYEQDILSLQNILNDKRAQLTPKTVEVIEQNLKVIDDAIRQSRAALAKDPGSRFLNRQLDRVRAKKIALLRTAALLPASA